MDRHPNSHSSRSDRLIRVFVSSTFLDMREERDHLVKFTFPKLRSICRDRDVEFIDVDLRWGVTDEQKAEGKVLSICLAEIKKCRPFFIGLLGERYGWIPAEIDEALVEERGWLKEQAGKSVTELEILHGVLRNPDMADHAYFYFRDPESSREIEAEIRRDTGYRTEPASSRKKLGSLKRSIEDGGFPIRPGYRDVVELDRLIMQDFTKVIDKLYPEGEPLDPLDREADEHEAYAKSRVGLYIERGDYFVRLDDHIDGDDQPLIVLGDSGVGKSALLANWARRYEKGDREAFLLCHYIGSSPYSADWTLILRRIIGEFNRRLGIDQEIPDDPAGLRTAFVNSLHKAAAKCRIVLVLDALNQLEDKGGALELLWLPPSIPENVRLVLSTLPGRSLDILKDRGWPTLTVEPFDSDARRQFIDTFLERYAKSLSPVRVDRIVGAGQTSNPHFLRTLLEELRLFGEHDRLDSRIDHYLEATTVKDLYRKIIARWQGDYEEPYDGLVEDAMSCIWAARRGLSEKELLDLLGKLKYGRDRSSWFSRLLRFFGRDRLETVDPLPAAHWAPLHLAAEDSLVERSGLIGFAHGYLREAIRDAFLDTEEAVECAHVRLADHFGGMELSDRTLDEYPWQLMSAGAWHELNDLLSSLEFFGAAWQANRHEVKRYWAAVEQCSRYRLKDAYLAVLRDPDRHRDQAWNIGTLLFSTGHMDLALELRELDISHFRRTGDNGNLASALNNRAGILHELGRSEEALEVQKDAENLFRTLGSADGLAMSLHSLAAILSSTGETTRAMAYLDEAEQLYASIGDDTGRATCLITMAHLHHQRGDLDRALEHYDSAEDIYRRHGDLVSESGCATDRAAIHFDRGNREEAYDQYRSAERMYRELGDKSSLLATLNTQGLILLERGDTTESMRLFEECESISLDLGLVDGAIHALHGKAEVFQKLGNFEDALEQHADLERLCRTSKRAHQLAQSLADQGQILQKMGDKKRSLAKFKEAENLGRQSGNSHTLAVTLRDQAMLLWSQGQLKEALAKSRESEWLYVNARHKQGMASSMDDQATILRDMGDLDESMSLMLKAEKLWRELNNKIGIAVCLGNQGLVLHKLDDPEGAMRVHDEEEMIYREIGSLEGLQRCIGNKGVLFENSGDLDRAMECYKEQERIASEIGAMPDCMTSIANQALVWDTKGESDKALEMLETVERYYRQTPDAISLQLALGNIGHILMDQGEPQEALSRFLEMETICKRIGYPEGHKKSLRSLADAYVRLEEHRKALVHLQELAVVADASGDMGYLVASLSRQAHIHRMAGEPDRALELLKLEEDACRRLDREDAVADCQLRQARLFHSEKKHGQALSTLSICRETAASVPDRKLERSALRLEVAILAEDERTEDIREAINKFDAILSEGEDEDARAWSLGIRAMLARVEGEMDESLDLLAAQKRLIESLGNAEDLLVNLKNRIDIEMDRDNMQEARELYPEHENLCRELRDEDALRENLKMQVALLMDLGGLENSWDKCMECLNLCRDASDEDGLVLCLLAKAEGLALKGEKREAVAVCAEGLRIIRAGPDPGRWDFYEDRFTGILDRVEGRVPAGGGQDVSEDSRQDADGIAGVFERANSCIAAGEYEEAIELLENAVRKYRNQGDTRSEAMILQFEGTLKHRFGFGQEASRLLRTAEELYRECGYPTGIMEVYFGLGAIHMGHGNLDDATSSMESALKLGRDLDNVPFQAASLVALGNIQYNRGDADSAGELYAEAEGLAREAGDNNSLQGALFGRALVATMEKDFTGAAAFYSEQKPICRAMGNYDALTRTLINEGHLLAYHLDSPKQGLVLLEEARELAGEHGLGELLEQVDRILASVRSLPE